MTVTTRLPALSRAECATTAVASTATYVTGGFPYLAGGVAGDLTGPCSLTRSGHWSPPD